jgi:RNA polymerase sigma-70 factor (ECF subfamily)
MQLTYVSTYFHLDQFRGAARFSTWLIRIAVHEAFARKRRRRRARPHRVFAIEGQESRRAGFRPRARRVLQEAIGLLPTSYRSVFVMREVEGLGTTETAECLGVSAENVKVRLHRARRRLQNEIHARVGTGVEAVLPFHAPRCDRVVAAVSRLSRGWKRRIVHSRSLSCSCGRG